MQAVVKTPHIDVDIKGRKIPENIIAALKKNYSKDLKIIIDPDEEVMDIFKTAWHKKIKTKMVPGKALKIYRENHGLSQEELGEKLGHVARQTISNMENGIRNISLKTARKLSKIFNVSVERFI